jgi:TP901 family phage tail tape measure protein
MSASAIIFAFFNTLKQGIQIVRDVDSAMTELKKVTDETDTTYARFLKTASSLGTEIGKSIPDVIRATAEFSKLGYALDEATNLAEKALILTNIGDGIDLSGSTEAITSAMKGFELDKTASDVERNSQRIIDAINEVANKYAVDVQDLAGSIQKMSAVMNQTGTSLEETMGMFTAGDEIMQDESKVSNGLLTIAQRLRGISEEGEDLSDLQPTLEKQFNKMGLTLLDSNGELKSTYNILNDLSTVWDSQSSQMQQYIGELIAGKFWFLSCQNVQKCA